MRGMGSRLVAIGLAAAAVLGAPSTPGVAAGVCAPRSVRIVDATKIEGAGLMNFTVLSNGCAGGTVQFQVLPGAGGYMPATAGADFHTGSGQIGWTSGEAGSKTIALFIVDDANFEPDEGLTVILQNPSGLSIVDDFGLGVIVDDEGPVVQVDSLSEPFCGMETCVSCRLRVVVDRPVPVDVSVEFATSNGTAESGKDFVAVKTLVTIPAGQTYVRIAVPILNDEKPEPTEYFFVSISQASVGHIAAGTVTAVITDDDAPVSAAPDDRLR